MIGGVVLAAGLVLTVIAMHSFFSSMGTMNPPKYFWCAFLGLPLIALGVSLLRFGFMGAVSRYSANEVVPVVSDATRQVLDDAKETLQDIVHPVGDVQSRLERLEHLKVDGLITPYEYATKRAEIIKAL